MWDTIHDLNTTVVVLDDVLCVQETGSFSGRFLVCATCFDALGTQTRSFPGMPRARCCRALSHLVCPQAQAYVQEAAYTDPQEEAAQAAAESVLQDQSGSGEEVAMANSLRSLLGLWGPLVSNQVDYFGCHTIPLPSRGLSGG